MKAPLVVRALGDSEFDEWGRLVAVSPDGSPYATAGYLDALCTSAGGRFKILGLRRGDDLIGGLPLYETESSRGLSVGPRLLLYYLGPVLDRSKSTYPSEQTARTVASLGAIAEALASLPYDKVLLKGRHTVSDVRAFTTRGWSAWPSYSYVVPLDDLTAQRGRVEQNLRRLIDRCAADGIVMTEDRDFDSFLRLHALTMEHHGAAHYLPDAAFRRWFALLSELGTAKLFHARLPDGKSIAAQVVLAGEHRSSHTVSAGLDPDHRRLGAGAFLRWRVFEWLAERGYRENDLTDAALNPVTHFKSQLGGTLVTNIVVETPGSVRWRAAAFRERAVRRVRRFGGSVIRSLRKKKDA